MAKKKAKSTTMKREFKQGDIVVKMTVTDRNNMTATRKSAKGKTTKKSTNKRRRKRGGDDIAYLFN